MSTDTAEARDVEAWMRVLDRIQATLERSLALTPELGPVAAGASVADAARQPLQRLDERLARLQARLDEAEQSAAQADVLLGKEAEALEHWLAGHAANRPQLADWLTHVGERLTTGGG
jgi:hypothetical protein